MGSKQHKHGQAKMFVPAAVRRYFWDADSRTLSLKDDKDFIIRRVLTNGNLSALTWLRRQYGDEEIADWLAQRKGAGLDPKTLRFLELVLSLNHQTVTRWISDHQDNPWQRRANLPTLKS